VVSGGKADAETITMAVAFKIIPVHMYGVVSRSEGCFEDGHVNDDGASYELVNGSEIS
jgi:hypothetical protein